MNCDVYILKELYAVSFCQVARACFKGFEILPVLVLAHVPDCLVAGV